ncbi:hypothetical protein [Singulisphaera sp. PoT]|uniref:hypothetical protein n=1 Tax=Singulisphaera sp. PoT TaxID=3411797 RepID=UPI003BF57722
MRQALRIATGLAIIPLLMTQQAAAQWSYPNGYGNYGWGGWGSQGAVDPAGGYMAGLGSYARGQGVYEVEDAKAQAINLDTMLKWNKALRARQRALHAEEAKEQAARDAQRDARVEQAEILNGSTLNNLLFQIYDFDPGVAKTSRVRTPIPATTIRDIPFEWDTEAISICIDQMTGKDSLPTSLTDASYNDERLALESSVDAAIKEDLKGEVSADSLKKVDAAIAALRAKFVKNTADFDPGYYDGLSYFNTLSSLSRLLRDASFKKILAQLEDSKDRTIGELIAFMQAYNLRFGPATSDRQIQIYKALAPMLAQVVRDYGANPPAPPAPDTTGAPLRSAAKDAFQKMQWEQLQAHSRDR